ncbi:MAG: alkaline phosphatase family protein, partial [Clostridia bacterium]
MENTFNKNPITQISGTLCKCMAINPPKFANSYMPELTSALLSQIDNTAFDRVLIFNPDAIGQWIYEKYYNKFELVRKHAPLEVKMLSVVPPKTPVCFASIYTGATPEEHGICHYEKPVLKIDTLFDALIRAGKKPCIV